MHLPTTRVSFPECHVVFGEVVRELISNVTFGFFNAAVRNFIVDSLLTSKERDQSQIIFITAHAIAISLAWRERFDELAATDLVTPLAERKPLQKVPRWRFVEVWNAKIYLVLESFKPCLKRR